MYGWYDDFNDFNSYLIIYNLYECPSIITSELNIRIY